MNPTTSTIATSSDCGRARRLTPETAMHDRFRDYPGSKGGAGVFQAIINQIPPHEVWIEAFAGSGQVTRRLRPAPVRIVVDCDAAVIAAWRGIPGLAAICADPVSWLGRYPWQGREVVYCDPPYLRAVRSCPRDYYRHEFATEAEHARLVVVLRKIPARVILSGYPSALYSRVLADWRVVTFQAVNRRGRKVTECLWCNFPEPFALHDYRWLGRNFRERERIKRKKARWRSRLLAMPTIERAAILETVADLIARNGDAGSQHRKRRCELATSKLCP
jgi:DNA adenine methylase